MLKLNKPSTPNISEPEMGSSEPPAATTGGSSTTNDPEVSDLENNLLGGGEPSETPEPTATDGGQTAQATAPQGGVDIKNIQQETGKLAQNIRTAGQAVSAQDTKAVINSILSAIDFSQYTDKDKNDIIKKIGGGAAAPTQTPSAPQSNPQAQQGVNELITPAGYNNEEPMGDNSPARFTASGGQTVGESAINEQLQRIIERAKANVQKKLNG